MAEKIGEGEGLDAVDFVINVLKEHEKELDKLIHQLDVITESLGKTGEITVKMGKLEEGLINLQNEIATLIKLLSSREASPPRQPVRVIIELQ
jgi:hypothetical protein